MTQQSTGRPSAPALIEGIIPLPGLTQLRSKSCVAQLYHGRHLSARQIAQLTEVSRSVVLAALKRCGIPPNGHSRTHPGQLPFGYDYQDCRLVKNQAEQSVIRMMGKDQAGGLTLRQIAMPARFPITHWNVLPDIVTFGKSFGNGFPVTAMVVSEENAGALEKISASSSYGGTPGPAPRRWLPWKLSRRRTCSPTCARSGSFS